MKRRRLHPCGVAVALAAVVAIASAGHAQCVPPQIVSQPLDRTVLVGDDVSFESLAIGTAPFFYTWRKDGGPLMDGGRIQGAGSARLSIFDVLTIDAADYDVVVLGLCGITASEAATLTVLLEAPLGDYNHNGIVDAADYTVWRDTLGSTTDLRANGDDTDKSAGVIDPADYRVWKLHFGYSSLPGESADSAAPEPGTFATLCLAIAAAGLRRHRLPQE